MKSTAKHIFLLVFAMVAIASIAVAQLPSGTVLGTVRDPAGAVVPGSTLTVTNTETALSRTVMSAADGAYRFPALPVGTYEVRAASGGFQTAVRSGIVLQVGEEAVVNFTLQVGELTQTVEVSADAQLVNTSSSALGAVVNAAAVADLPLNGRNYIDLTFLQPGIVKQETTTAGGTFVGSWFSSNGMPLRSNTYMIDGAVMQNVLGGTTSSIANNTLGIEGIREWRVVANNFSAEYGLTMGSQMEIVTKSGTNSYHGTLFEYFRNSALDARNFFDYQTVATPGRLPPFRRNNFGGSVGGPIMKDKLFFFGTYEALRERFGVTSLGNTIPDVCRVEPLPAQCRPTSGSFSGITTIDPRVKAWVPLIPRANVGDSQFTYPFNRPTTENYGQGRLDYAMSNNDTLFGRYTENQTTQINPLLFPGFVTDRYSRNRYITAAENHIFSSTLLNQFRFSYSDTALQLTSPSEFTGPEFEMIPGKGAGVMNIAGVGEVGPRFSAPLGQAMKVLSFSDDIYWTKGAHSLKFGFLFNNYRPNWVSGPASVGTVAFSSYQNFLVGDPTRYTAKWPGSQLTSEYRFNTIGLYVQDDWKVNSRFTMNLGLRYEPHTDPYEIDNLGVSLRHLTDPLPVCADPLCAQGDDPGRLFINPSRKNFSPRVGFAWDVFGNGKTALRGGSAILFDVVTFNPAISGLGWPYSVTSTTGGPAADAFSFPLKIPTALSAASPTGLDYNLKQPYSSQSNLTLEQELPWQTTLQLSYAMTRGIKLLRHAEQNPTIPYGTPVNGACVNSGGPVKYLSTPYCFTGTEPRINTVWNSMNQVVADSNSWYHGLQFQLRKRMSRGLQFQSSYTWSKSIDETENLTDAENEASHFAVANGLNRGMDKAPSSFDIRHNYSFNALYALPRNANATGLVGGLVNGWRLGGIFRYRTGLPFSPALGAARSRSGTLNGPAGLDRPDYLPGVVASDLISGTSSGCARSGGDIAPGTPVGTPDLWFDPCGFGLPAAGFFGNAGRDSMRGPNLSNLDFSITKDTPLRMLGEAGRLEFRVETFNLFNHASFKTPAVGVADSAAAGVVFPGNPASIGQEARLDSVGIIQGTSTLSRQIQMALKIVF